MPALVLDDDRPLAAALLVEQLDAAVDLGDDGGLLGPPGLEQLGDARQAAGDVLRAADLARGLGQQGAGGDLLPLVRPRCPPARGCSCRRGCAPRRPR